MQVLRLMTWRRVRRVRRVVWWFHGGIAGLDDVVVLKLAHPMDCGGDGSRIPHGICYAVATFTDKGTCP